MTASASSISHSELRSIAKQRLKELEDEAQITQCPSSWIENNNQEQDFQARFFNLSGFIHVPNFVSQHECQILKDEMQRLVDEEWNPQRDMDCFGTDDAQNLARGDYFLESANRTHFFAEPHALQEDKQRLLPKYVQQNKKIQALNKAGHGLHIRDGPFREYCLSDPIRNLVRNLGWVDPVVPQSMYIFKQAETGGAVHSHQDSTFLFTTPRQSCLGLWLALDEATLDNGCLWVRPKSHQEPLRRQYKRNPAHFGEKAIEQRSNHAQGDVQQPKFIMENLVEHHNVPWEGQLPGTPDELLVAGFIPVECQPGDLLMFCGELDHLSLPNTSNKARHTFQLHLVDGTTNWSEYNWLQYPPDIPFLRLNP